MKITPRFNFICDGRKREDCVLLECLRHDYAIWHFIRYQRIAEAANKMYGKYVLDVGCGIGLQDFLLKNKTVVSVDVNFENVREARRNEGTMEAQKNTTHLFVTADLHSMPFREKFDIIISSEVLEHLKNDSRAFEVMLSLLRENGFLIVTVPNALRFALRRIALWRKTIKMYPTHLREYSVGDIFGLSKSFSLKMTEMNGIFLDFPIVHFVDGLFHIFKKLLSCIIFRFSVYSTVTKLYAKLWLPLEKLFWHRTFYVFVIFRKT